MSAGDGNPEYNDNFLPQEGAAAPRNIIPTFTNLHWSEWSPSREQLYVRGWSGLGLDLCSPHIDALTKAHSLMEYNDIYQRSAWGHVSLCPLSIVSVSSLQCGTLWFRFLSVSVLHISLWFWDSAYTLGRGSPSVFPRMEQGTMGYTGEVHLWSICWEH